MSGEGVDLDVARGQGDGRAAIGTGVAGTAPARRVPCGQGRVAAGAVERRRANGTPGGSAGRIFEAPTGDAARAAGTSGPNCP
jgi:hypothetical protein